MSCADRLKKNWVPVLVGVVGILLAFGIWWFWATVGVEYIAGRLGNSDKPSIEVLGQVGDLFGGVNALFAALAFVGVGVSVFYQHRALRISQSQQTQQSFEPLFFHLLDLQRKVASDARVVVPHAWSTHVDNHVTLDAAGKLLRTQILDRWAAIVESRGKDRIRLLSVDYDLLYTWNEAVLGPYFRSMYHVYALIDRALFDQAEKDQYASIARALISSETLFLLMINCLTERGEGLGRFVARYGLLKHATMADGAGPSAEALIIEWCYPRSSVQSRDERSRL